MCIITHLKPSGEITHHAHVVVFRSHLRIPLRPFPESDTRKTQIITFQDYHNCLPCSLKQVRPWPFRTVRPDDSYLLRADAVKRCCLVSLYIYRWSRQTETHRGWSIVQLYKVNQGWRRYENHNLLSPLITLNRIHQDYIKSGFFSDH